MEHEKSKTAMTAVISQAGWCTIGLWAGSGQRAVAGRSARLPLPHRGSEFEGAAGVGVASSSQDTTRRQ